MTEIELPDDRVTENVVKMLVRAYPHYRVTMHTDTDDNQYIMFQIPKDEDDFNQEAAGEFVSMVSELGHKDV